jgi:hypothetical protein
MLLVDQMDAANLRVFCLRSNTWKPLQQDYSDYLVRLVQSESDLSSTPI